MSSPGGFKPANAQNFAVICKNFKNDCKMYKIIERLIYLRRSKL